MSTVHPLGPVENPPPSFFLSAVVPESVGDVTLASPRALSLASSKDVQTRCRRHIVDFNPAAPCPLYVRFSRSSSRQSRGTKWPIGSVSAFYQLRLQSGRRPGAFHRAVALPDLAGRGHGRFETSPGPAKARHDHHRQ